MISPSQCIMARSRMRLSVEALAKEAGVSHMTIRRFENGESEPNAENMKKIHDFFYRSGRRFGPNNSVSDASINSYTLEGPSGFRLFFDEVYEAARDLGGEFCIFNGVPNKIIESVGEEWYKAHAHRMMKIKDNFTFRVLLGDDEKNLIGVDFAIYKHFSTEYRQNGDAGLKQEMIYIFGEKVAIISFKTNIKIMVIESFEYSHNQKMLFNLAWDMVK